MQGVAAATALGQGVMYRVLQWVTALGDFVMYRVVQGDCARRGCDVQVVAGDSALGVCVVYRVLLGEWR